MSATFPVHLPEVQKAFLDRLATQTDRSRDLLVSDVVSKMMENYNHVMSLVEEGERDIAAGRVQSMEDVEESSLEAIRRHTHLK